MRTYPNMTTSVARLAVAIGCTPFLFGMAASASAATPYEVNLASESQALAYCQSGSMPTNDIAYINSSKGLVQFGAGLRLHAKEGQEKTDEKRS